MCVFRQTLRVTPVITVLVCEWDSSVNLITTSYRKGRRRNTFSATIKNNSSPREKCSFFSNSSSISFDINSFLCLLSHPKDHRQCKSGI